MKVAVISDIHDNLINLQKCLNWCRDNIITELICCGDIANSETLKFLSSGFLGKIHLVEGNAELYFGEEVEQYRNICYYGKIGFFEIDEFKVGACHENFLIDKIMQKQKVNIIFYGHTHKPWIEEKANVKIVNPGALGGGTFNATFAAWDTLKKSIGLIKIDDLPQDL